MTVGALVLARYLRRLDDDALGALALRRKVDPAAPQDFFDLAEALLGRQGVRRALRHIARPSLAVLAVLAHTSDAMTPAAIAAVLRKAGARDADEDAVREAVPPLVASALVLPETGGHRCLPPVAAQILDWPAQGLPDLAALCATPEPVDAARHTATEDAADRDEAADRAASRTAFTGIGAVAGLVDRIDAEHGLAAHKGRPSAASLRRLAAALHTGPDGTGALLRLAAHAGLVSTGERITLVPGAARDWLGRPRPQRWRHLAAAWLRALPERTRTILTQATAWGAGLPAFARWLYPAAGHGLDDHVAAVLAEAAELGLTGPGGRTRAGLLLFTRGADTAAQALAEHFPAPVDTVYLQDDATIIAPGPLRADLDARLRDFCRAEGSGMASSYRVTEESVTRAVARGLQAAGFLDFLAGISSGGVPQPLEYLVTEVAARYGRIRVGPAAHYPALRAPAGGSVIRSTDDTLLRTLEVDRTLQHLAVRRAGGMLASPRPPETVLEALAAQHYPAAPETPEEPPSPAAAPQAVGQAPRSPAAGSPDSDGAAGTPPAARLIARLRRSAQAAGADLDRLWIGRALTAAARTKSEVGLAVRLPDGGIRDYRLELTGISARRVRGRDTTAGVERTVPLASIESIAL